MKKISILIPAYNEEETLPTLIYELTNFIDNTNFSSVKYEFEIVIVDDGSKDRTIDILYEQYLKDSRFNYIGLSRNFGKENALLAGLDTVKGDCCVIIDADLQHPLNCILEMIHWWEKGYDDVYGERLTRGKESCIRRKFSLVYYRILQKITKIDILPNVGDFRLLDRKCIDKLTKLRECQRYNKGLFVWVGYKKKAVLFEQRDSIRSKSSFNFSGLLNLATEGITSFTTAPLRMATFGGMFLALLSLLYLVWILIKTIIFGEEVQGFPTLMCAILFLGAFQLIAIGIVGEYIGRIFNESKRRPPYIISSHNGVKV